MKKFPKLNGKAILSPMAGVTDVAFRALSKKYGAALTCTEFLNSIAINRKNKKTLEMLKTDPNEKPKQIQLFGNSIEEVVNAAKFVENKFDIIDINCGCPAWKVIKTGAGSELLKNPTELKNLIEKLNSAVKISITIKIRIGIGDKNINAVKIARLAENAGAAAIAVHGRTQKQGYSGEANWKIIRDIKKSVKIPVIGNGDVFTPEIFKKRLNSSNVDYIMVARGAIGNPYIFKQINDFLNTGKYGKKDPIEQFFEYYKLAKKYNIPFSQIKSQAISFTKGVKSGNQIRRQLSTCKNEKEILETLKKHK